MTFGFKASAMPFGKRGLVRDEEPHDSAVSYPVLPPNATTIEWLICFWKGCKMIPALRGVISFGHHVLLSGIFAVAILFISPALLSRFAETITPYWPLLARARPYMDSHGHHELFLYMSAMYFKDMMLSIIFVIRNLFSVIPLLFVIKSRVGISLGGRSWVGLIAPLFLVVYLDQTYFGPVTIPQFMNINPIFGGGVFQGLVLPGLVYAPIAVQFFSQAPLLFLFSGLQSDGAKIIRDAQMRKLS